MLPYAVNKIIKIYTTASVEPFGKPMAGDILAQSTAPTTLVFRVAYFCADDRHCSQLRERCTLPNVRRWKFNVLVSFI